MAIDRSLGSTTLSSRKNVTRGRTRSASFGLWRSMLKGPRTFPKTFSTPSTTAWCSGATSGLPVTGATRGITDSFLERGKEAERSAALEGRLALLAPRGVALGLVLGQLEGREPIEVDERGVGEVGDVEAAEQGLLGQRRGQRRQGGEVPRHLERLVHQAGVRHHPLGEADPVRLLGVEGKAEGEAHGVTAAHPSGETGRAAVRGKDAEGDLRQAPFRP